MGDYELVPEYVPFRQAQRILKIRIQVFWFNTTRLLWAALTLIWDSDIDFDNVLYTFLHLDMVDRKDIIAKRVQMLNYYTRKSILI